MIMSKPPFEITEKILNLVAIITEKITRLEINMDRKKDLFLRKSNIRKYFGRFIKLHILMAIGETKGRKYKLNKEILSGTKDI
jgi:hypothetical protein